MYGLGWAISRALDQCGRKIPRQLRNVARSAAAGEPGVEPGPRRPKRRVLASYTTPQGGLLRRYYDATVPAPTVVILAAGEGTRMRSSLPKVLHPLLGRPIIAWPIAAAREAGAGKIVVVDGPQGRLADHLPDGVATATQQEPKGTGDAVQAAAEPAGGGEAGGG